MVLVLVEIGGAESLYAMPHQKQVLVLHSVRRDAQISVIGDRDIPRAIEEGLKQDVDYYSEYLDNARFSRADYRATFRDFLREKYKGHKFDVIIAMSTTVVQFLDKNRRELFPDTPVVFFETTPAPRFPNSTGIISELNLVGTVDLARRLQPDLQHVFVVSGSGHNDRTYEHVARKQLRSIEPVLPVTYLSGLPTGELEKRLATLPPRSMVFYLVVSRDGLGEYFHPMEYLDRVAIIANAPTYSWVDSTLDHGIVGGSLRSQTNELSMLVGLALRVLRGERADTIEPVHADLNVAQVDWRQLRRWNISEARVPTGTMLMFQEPTLWSRYRNYVLGTGVLFVAQSMLIALLLIQGSRRRQAERRARTSQVRLRTSYERIRDLGSRLLTAQEEERTRIARELHDDVGQQLALLAIDLELIGGAGQNLETETGTLIYETLNRARGIAKSVHDLSHRLHPEKLHLLGLVPALSAIQREFSHPDLKLTFVHRNVPTFLPLDVTLCLFRTAQEALQNIVKHSSAHEVSIDLVGTANELVLTIVDDGRGFDGDTVRNKGLGLISMGERLDAIGGSLRIWTRPGAGTRLEIAVPQERLATAPL